jgi:hypothetical protein
VRERGGGVFGGGVCASGLGKGKLPKKKGKKKKVESKNVAAWTANRATQQILDPGRLRPRLRRRRRFQTIEPWLFFLAFSTYLTRIASRCPMLAIIQIVHLRASSTPVNNKDQPGTQSSTREGNAGDGFDLIPQMISFLKRGRKDAMNIPSSNRG